jgi:hypothetical protein
MAKLHINKPNPHPPKSDGSSYYYKHNGGVAMHDNTFPLLLSFYIGVVTSMCHPPTTTITYI